MTPPVSVFALDDRALPFLRVHLECGMNGLCTTLAEVIEQVPGDVSTLAPVGTDPERLHDFEAGGLLPDNLDFSRARRVDDRWIMPVASLSHLQAEQLFRALHDTPGVCALVDDVLSEPSDEHLARDPTAFVAGNAVYRLLLPGDDLETVSRVLDEGDTLWHGISVLCRPGRAVARDAIATPEALDALARTAVEINFRAYDGEGFVTWRCRADGEAG
jgi:hypothetical protein